MISDQAGNTAPARAPAGGALVGAHAAAGGPFTILRFPEPDLPDLVYLEQLNRALYLDQPDDVIDYVTVMDQLCVQAEAGAASKDIAHYSTRPKPDLPPRALRRSRGGHRSTMARLGHLYGDYARYILQDRSKEWRSYP